MEYTHFAPRDCHQAVSDYVALSNDRVFLHAPKVLLVEDNVLARKSQQLMLENLGCEVTVVKDALSGLKAFHSQFDAVILDKDLPDFSGIELARLFRRHEPYLPIIVCTGSENFESVKSACESVGVNAVLPKPMKLEKIYWHLSECLKHWVH